MDKKAWAGALVLAVAVGIGAKAVMSALNRPRPENDIATKQPTDDVAAPFSQLPKSPLPPAPASRASVADDVYEPIVTRPEATASSEEDPPPLPTSGGTEESDAAAVFAPRPDRDGRHMPYADEHDGCEYVAVVVWLAGPVPAFTPTGGLFMNVSLPRRPAPDLSEESEEPPISEQALPSRFHPPHCPFGGHCPYPNPYR